MEIIECKICGKLFYQIADYGTCSDFMYDYNACKECNKEAKGETPEDVKVKLLLSYLKAIEDTTGKYATSDHILRMIREMCKQAKDEVKMIKELDWQAR